MAVNNTLSAETVPQASFVKKSFGISFAPTFDFFNYAGILRSVYLLKLPILFIKEIQLFSDFEGRFEYQLTLNQKLMPEYDVQVFIKSKNNEILWKNSGVEGKTKFEVGKFKSWWPRGFGKQNLYFFEATITNVPKQKTIDIYRESFGFRSVNVSRDQIFINGKPFYCAGFGMHEDFDVGVY